MTKSKTVYRVEFRDGRYNLIQYNLIDIDEEFNARVSYAGKFKYVPAEQLFNSPEEAIRSKTEEIRLQVKIQQKMLELINNLGVEYYNDLVYLPH